ncbi:putative Protein S-acyltransferase 24 [Paratrimastix pyriformis]|uniref:Palmitoyltransferase n=1 Tax=Paratrimastix pyriformis TaxID=342808 RepID=A0ABQ8URA4_9EUKA|nr:putative Protein S-acyltransferase 24 [Paratrimastix pyriformis]
MVDFLISQGVEINTPDRKGQRPLHWAALTGNIQICKLLLDNGADVDARDNNGYTSLIVAVQHGFLMLVQYLLYRHASDALCDQAGHSPLHWAAFQGDRDLVEFFITQRHLSPNVVDHERMTPLHWAALRGHLPVTRPALLSLHPPPRLHASTHPSLLFSLTEPPAPPRPVRRDAKDGLTPAGMAARKHHTDVVRSLKRARMLAPVMRVPAVGRLFGRNFRRLSVVLIFTLVRAPVGRVGWAGAVGAAVALVRLVAIARNDRAWRWRGGAPRVLSHLAISPHLVSHLISPHLASHLISSHLTLPLISSHLTLPLISSHLTSPCLSSHLTSPHFASHLTRHYRLWWLGYLAFSLLFFGTYCRALLADPGRLPQRPVCEAYIRDLIIIVIAWLRGMASCLRGVVGSVQDLEKGRGGLCPVCHIRRPLRAKHCRVCGRCVARLDHHCSYTGGCVGLRNQGSFVRWLVLFVGGIAYWNATIALFLFAMQGLSLSLLPLLGGLLRTQLAQIARNITTNERLNAARYAYLHTPPTPASVSATTPAARRGGGTPPPPAGSPWPLASPPPACEFPPARLPPLEALPPGPPVEPIRFPPEPSDPRAAMGGAAPFFNPFDRGILRNLIEFCGIGPDNPDYFKIGIDPDPEQDQEPSPHDGDDSLIGEPEERHGT